MLFQISYIYICVGIDSKATSSDLFNSADPVVQEGLSSQSLFGDPTVWGIFGWRWRFDQESTIVGVRLGHHTPVPLQVYRFEVRVEKLEIDKRPDARKR